MHGSAGARLAKRVAGSAIVLSMLAAAPPAAHAAGFAAPQERHAAASVSTYTDLLRALARRAIRSATLDDRAHVAAVVFRDGRRADVRYPAADATLPRRLANAGAEVRIAQGSAGLLTYLTPLLVISLLIMAAVFGPSPAPTAHRRDGEGRRRHDRRAARRRGAGVAEDTLRRRRGLRRGGGGARRDRRVPAYAGAVRPRRCAHAGRPVAFGASGDRQDDAGARARRRGGRALLRGECVRVRGEVRRRGREQGARPVQARPRERACGDLHRRARCDRGKPQRP